MIIEKIGSIFDSKADCIVNPVNCVGVMGGGLALDFKRLYPDMFSRYKLLCASNELRIGSVAFWYPSDEASHVVCLFPTKDHWRNPSTVAYIEASLRAFVEFAPLANITSVAFPKVGCGLGGLDYDLEVKPLLYHHLSNCQLTVEIYS